MSSPVTIFLTVRRARMSTDGRLENASKAYNLNATIKVIFVWRARKWGKVGEN